MYIWKENASMHALRTCVCIQIYLHDWILSKAPTLSLQSTLKLCTQALNQISHLNDFAHSIQFNSIQNMFIVQCTASIQNSISYHNQGWVLQQYLKIRHTRQALSRGNTVSVQMLSRVISKKAIYSHKSNSPRHSGRGSAGHSVPRVLWYVNTSWRR